MVVITSITRTASAASLIATGILFVEQEIVSKEGGEVEEGEKKHVEERCEVNLFLSRNCNLVEDSSCNNHYKD
jgi:hypothetical protein